MQFLTIVTSAINNIFVLTLLITLCVGPFFLLHFFIMCLATLCPIQGFVQLVTEYYTEFLFLMSFLILSFLILGIHTFFLLNGNGIVSVPGDLHNEHTPYILTHYFFRYCLLILFILFTSNVIIINSFFVFLFQLRLWVYIISAIYGLKLLVLAIVRRFNGPRSSS